MPATGTPLVRAKDFYAERAGLFVSAAPFTLEHEDYVQILTDIATRLGPALGWQPATGPEIGTGT